MAGRATIRMTIAVLLAVSSAAVPAEAQPLVPAGASLGQPNPVSRVSGVQQFGVPGDAKYIFCDGADCADRTLKHISDPPPVPPFVMPRAPEVEDQIEVSRAKVVPKKPIKKHKRKKHKPVVKKKSVVSCAADIK